MLMAERGVEAVGLADITDAADLGSGTFYNYFQSREEIVDAVADATVESMGQALDQLANQIGDPAEVFSASLRHLVLRAISDPMWGWFVVRLGVGHPRLHEILGPRAARDLRNGVEQGCFVIPDIDIATACTFGALVSTLHLVISGSPVDQVDILFARTMLAMMGLSGKQAHEVASRPLPELPSEPAAQLQ